MRSPSCSPTRPRARRWPPPPRPPPRPTYSWTRIAARTLDVYRGLLGEVTAVEVIFWIAAGAIVYTHVGYPVLLWVLSRFVYRPEPERTGELPSRLADRRGPRRGGGDRREGRQRARARLPARAARGDRCLRRLDRSHRRARPRGRRRPRARAAANRQARHPERRRCARDGRAARLQRCERDLAPGRAAPAGRTRSPTREVGYACGQASFTGQGGSNQEGVYWRYELAVRRLESGLAGITAGNGAIYAVRRSAYVAARPGVEPRPRRSRSCCTSAGCARSTSPTAIAEEKMVATNEGEFARKRRMMRGVYDEVVGDGMLSPRGYRPVLRVRDLQPPAAALRHPAPAPDRARRQPRPARRGLRSTSSTLAAQLAAARGRGARPARAAAAAAPRPVLRARRPRRSRPASGIGSATATPGAWEKAEGTR